MSKHSRFVRGWVVGGVLAGMALAAPPSSADPTAGLCNSLIAQALGTGLQVAKNGPTVEQCTEIGLALQAVLSPPCDEVFNAGELALATVASGAFKGEVSPLGAQICTGLDQCGFLPIPGVCELPF